MAVVMIQNSFWEEVSAAVPPAPSSTASLLLNYHLEAGVSMSKVDANIATWYDSSPSGSLIIRKNTGNLSDGITSPVTKSLNGKSTIYSYYPNTSYGWDFTSDKRVFYNWDWTFIGLVKIEDWANDNNYHSVFHYNEAGGNSLIIVRMDLNNYMNVLLRDTAGQIVQTTSNGTIGDNTWRILVAKWNKVEKKLYGYCSGSSNVTASNASFSSTEPWDGSRKYSNLGSFTNDAGAVSHKGRMEFADISIYRSALSNDDINTICNDIATKYALNTGSTSPWVNI